MPRTGGVEVESLVRWLQAIIGVLQTAASSSDFFQRAAQAVVEIVGLDTGRVLILDHEEWRVEARHLAAAAAGGESGGRAARCSRRLRREKRTFWQEPDQSGLQARGGQPDGADRRRGGADPRPSGRGHRRPLRRAPAGRRRVAAAPDHEARRDARGAAGQRRGGRPGPARAGEGGAGRPGPVRAVLHARAGQRAGRPARPAQGPRPGGHAAVLRHPRLQPDQRAARARPAPSTGSAT